MTLHLLVSHSELDGYKRLSPVFGTERGNCPRCGSHIWEGGDIPEEACPVCEWNWDKNDGDSCPPPYDCACYEIFTWEAEQAEQDAYQRMLRGE